MCRSVYSMKDSGIFMNNNYEESENTLTIKNRTMMN